MTKFSAVLLIALMAIIPNAFAASRASDFVSANNYSVMEPYLNNRQRAALNPTGTSSSSSNTFNRTVSDNGNAPLSAYARSANNSSSARRVVSRGTTARSAVSGNNVVTTNSGVARSASTSGGTATNTSTRGTTSSRDTSNVYSRGTSGASRRVVARSARGDDSTYYSRVDGVNEVIADTTTVNENLSMERCLADYTTCMDQYCHREDASYDRCYCSSKLAQIDAEYRPAIEELVMKLAMIKDGYTGASMTDEELEAYWQETFAAYTGDNALSGLNSSLDIDWSDTESRVRGQNAFITGHEYCIQHLTGCFYAADNMRAIYRSSIERDCQTYENSLEKIKNAAESAVNYYSE